MSAFNARLQSGSKRSVPADQTAITEVSPNGSAVHFVGGCAENVTRACAVMRAPKINPSLRLRIYDSFNYLRIARVCPLEARQENEGRPMRWVISVAVLATASTACAADLDLDTLRGSQPVGPATFTRWSGFDFGGQIGFSDANADFRGDTPLVHYSCANRRWRTTIRYRLGRCSAAAAATPPATAGLSDTTPNGRTWSSASRATIRTPPPSPWPPPPRRSAVW